MSNKRVSVKGKGAELFFGELESASVGPNSQQNESSPTSTSSQIPPSGSQVSDDGPPSPPSRKKQPNKKAARSSHKSSPTSRHQPPITLTDETLEQIQRIVKHSGREVSYVRLSPGEKERVAEIVYTYKRQGMKVSETDIHRIALNYLLADYDQNQDASVLASVLASVKA